VYGERKDVIFSTVVKGFDDRTTRYGIDRGEKSDRRCQEVENSRTRKAGCMDDMGSPRVQTLSSLANLHNGGMYGIHFCWKRVTMAHTLSSPEPLSQF
jgi:hypothetical protein